MTLDTPITLLKQAEPDDWYILSATTVGGDGDMWHDFTSEGSGYDVNNNIRGIGLNNNSYTDTRWGVSDTEAPLNYAAERSTYYIANLAVKVPVISRTPANGDTVPVGTSLEWTLSEYVTSSVEVYFGNNPDPNLVEAGNTSGSYLLSSPGTYYWSLVTYDPNDGGTMVANRQEDEWQVTVVANPLISLVSPEVSTVAAGGSAVLSVTASNEETIRWAKDGVDIPDTDANFSGQDSETLTILDFQQAQEGLYTCTATNNAGSVVSEVGVTVYLEQLVMHYPLDDVSEVYGEFITPDVVSGYDLVLKNAGTGTEIPSLVTASGDVVVGSGAMLFGDATGADIPQAYTTSISKNNIFRNGCTVEFWYKKTGDTTRCTTFILVDDASEVQMRAHTPWDDSVYWDSSSDRLSKGIGDINFSNWVHMAFTKDVYNSTTKIFVNGTLVAVATNQGSAIGDVFELYLNENSNFGNIKGILDDVKFYNYARSTNDIAKDYLDGSGDTFVCDLEGTADMTFDFNGDCEVSLPDFAIFAVNWLTDNRIYSAQ